MSSLSPKDRVSLCSFTFSDGRRCRTPRTGKNPRFCFYHAQKETRARTAQKLGKDLAYFFSGDYLSACDLSTALAHLIPAVVRGDVKPKTAHTVAYLAQTLMQAIHLSKHEYINAFGTDAWRDSVRTSVNGNRDYLFPPDPDPEQPALSALRTNLRSESSQPQPAAVAHPGIYPACPEHLGDPVGRGEALRPASPPQPAAMPNSSAKATPPQPTEIPASCHSERSEEPAFSSSGADHSPLVTRHPSPVTRHSPLATSSTRRTIASPTCRNGGEWAFRAKCGEHCLTSGRSNPMHEARSASRPT
jgi:hypothetical protein